jgi:DNA-binding transcriptional LysR family regulator
MPVSPEFLVRVSEDIRGNLRANDFEMLREAALAGLGLSLVPTWLIGGDLEKGRHRPVLA